MQIALKIDVDGLRATREAVPKLIEILQRNGAGATFLFSLGPGTSLHGWLRGTDIGRRCAAVMKRARDAGFEAGVHAWDASGWRARVMGAGAGWTTWQMALAAQRFREVFGEEPLVHGAPDWRMNVHAFRRTQAMGYLYASDTRGTHPYVPVIRAEIVGCPQFPTTLPTLEEMIGHDAAGEADVAERALAKTEAADRDHVFTVRAGSEGLRLAGAFERLLAGWKSQGYGLVAMRDLVAQARLNALPLHTVVEAPVPGRPGTCATQGPGFLA